MLINVQPLGRWGRRLSCWLLPKARPSQESWAHALGWKMLKWNPISVLLTHSSHQYYLIDTISSWSSGWVFISHVEREWYFRILFFSLFAKGLTFKVSRFCCTWLHESSFTMHWWTDSLPLPFSPCAFNAPCNGIGKLCVFSTRGVCAGGGVWQTHGTFWSVVLKYNQCWTTNCVAFILWVAV